MQTLLLEFPARRYHATPWGHHVNEGLIEWPPSPWRLLRALLAAGYTTDIWNGDGPPALARSLIEKLASILPRYRIPRAIGTHSRHYMPLARFKSGREETTLVFDTWAQVDSGLLAITWDVSLTEEESTLLADLAERLSYLGRSESWITARLVRDNENLPDGLECYPCDTPPSPGWEQVPLMAAMNRDEYAKWREKSIESVLATIPAVDPNEKKLTREKRNNRKERKVALVPYPQDLIACLQAETSWLREQGWSQPPGSRRVFYWRPAGALETSPPRSHCPEKQASTVQAMLLSQSTMSGNNHALPSVIRTLPQAELLHRALVKSAAGETTFSPVLIGRDEYRRPLRGRHEHAHVMPLDLDGDGHIDHLLVWAPMGLDFAAQRAVRSTRRTFAKGWPEPLRLALSMSGSIEELRLAQGRYGNGLRSVLAASDGCTDWISITPFVPPRFVKAKGRNTLEGQILAELASRGLPEPSDVRLANIRDNPALIRQRHFIRTRRYGPAPPIDCGFQIELTFAEPVHGPLCLGYASHFGLGMFAAME